MFYHVRGKLIHVEEGMAAVECAGVAFALKTTNNTLSKLPALQSEVTLYTYFLVREGAMELYGFYDQGELNCFQMLLTVSGVGPKAALAILSHLSPEKFALCVATGDVKSITRAQGVGPKLAQRLILELKDKVQKEQIANDADLMFHRLSTKQNTYTKFHFNSPLSALLSGLIRYRTRLFSDPEISVYYTRFFPVGSLYFMSKHYNL